MINRKWNGVEHISAMLCMLCLLMVQAKETFIEMMQVLKIEVAYFFTHYYMAGVGQKLARWYTNTFGK
jgi:hypothetical protein